MVKRVGAENHRVENHEGGGKDGGDEVRRARGPAALGGARKRDLLGYVVVVDHPALTPI